jgi:hypothetical protein
MKNNFTFTLVILILGLLVMSMVVVQPVSCNPLFAAEILQRERWRNLLADFLFEVMVKAVLASVNAILLTILLAIYLGIYRKTGSEFSLGLVIFSLALLLYSLTSNPIIQRVAGFRGSGLGPFTMLPDLFTCIASAILLYLSRK